MTPFQAKYRLERSIRPFDVDAVRGMEPDSRGLYALWLPAGSLECLYVGVSATCVRRRLLSHLYSEANPCLRREMQLFGDGIGFSVALCGEDTPIFELEASLIREWQPLCNRTHRT